MPIGNIKNNGMDIPLGLSMVMAQNPTVLPLFESLDNDEIKSLAGIRPKGSTDLFGQVAGLYNAADSFGRTRMF